MKREYRAHPLMLFRWMQPFLFFLILPVFQSIFRILHKEPIGYIFLPEILLLAVLFCGMLLRLRSFRLVLTPQGIALYSGLFFRKRVFLPRRKITSVTLLQNPIDTVCQAVTLSLNTEAGRAGKADYECKLFRRDAEALASALFGESPRGAVRFSWKRLALSAALTSSAVGGLVVGIPLLRRLGKLFGRAFEQMLLQEINTVSQRFQTYFPPIFNTVLLILLISYGVSFASSFFRSLRFRLFAGKEHFEVHSGLLMRRRTIFPRNAIRAVSVEQSLLMHFFNRYMLYSEVAGLGTDRVGRAVLGPAGEEAEIRAFFEQELGGFSADGAELRPIRGKRGQLRFLRIPLLCTILLAAVTAVAMWLVPYFERFILLIALICLLLIFRLGLYFRYDYRFGRIAFGERLYARAATRNSFCEWYLPMENIGLLRISRTPADRRFGTCCLRITLRSERRKSLKIWHLREQAVREKSETFEKE